MSYRIISSSTFRSDLKRVQKRGYNLELLETVVTILASGESLPPQYKDHSLLGGEYKNCRECHILPDWLLVYQIQDDELILYLTRTGTHSDLF